MSIWASTIQVHHDVPHHILAPTIDIYASIESITRSGTTISANVYAYLKAGQGSQFQFGYPLGVAASIDGGQVVKIFDKPAEPSVWPDKYGENEVVCTSTNVTTDVKLHIWFYAMCTCPPTTDVPSVTIDGNVYYEVATYDIPNVVPPGEYTVTVKANGGRFKIGGTYTTSDQILTKIQDQPLSINYTIERNGYLLAGISTSQDTLPKNAAPMPISYTTNADVTFYAIWDSFIQVKTSDGWEKKKPVIWQKQNDGNWHEVAPYYVCKTIGGEKGWCRSDDLTKLAYGADGRKKT